MCSDSLVRNLTGGTIVRAVLSTAHVETGPPGAQQGQLVVLLTTVGNFVENFIQHGLTVTDLDYLWGWHQRKPKKAAARYAICL